jgi:exo-1,4-beta-D-glucosaminidase
MKRHSRVATLTGAATGVLVLLGGLALLAVPGHSGAAVAPAAKVSGTAGATATLAGWQIRDSAQVSDSGPAISQPGYAASGWLSVAPRSTVMAGLVENGRYPNVFTSTNMKNVDANQFKRDWWYRSTFTVSGGTGLHTVLHLAGVIPRADVWLNGTQIATRTQVAGAHNAVDVDITGTVKAGANAIALRIPPADPNKDLITGWIDWNPAPPDHNQGIWQDAALHQSGPVALTDLRVTTALALPGLGSADVTAKVDAHNNTTATTTATVAGTLAGNAVTQQVSLAAGQTRTVTFTTHLTSPRVWWPVPLGDHPTYQAELTATVAGAVSDSAQTTFGVRDVKSSLDGSGHRVFTVNGKPLLIRSGGWASDIFLRTDTARLRRQFDIIRDLGLNSIRLEGKLETDEFYDLADQYGILLLPGWECCDKWQSLSSWSDADYQVAFASMSATAKRIRNHPSVLAYLVGSDEAPNARAETGYLDALHKADWPDPIVTAASDRSSPQLGKSGMKMDGPYDYVPPNYWYGSQLGAAFGFASELSAGPNVPELDALKAMLSTSEQDALWKNPGGTQYHAGLNGFNNLKLYGTAIQNRYGKPTSLADFVTKAQLTNYENNRAQFEAYAARMDRSSNPATGVVYWMLNNGWPSLIWHLYDWYLAPSAGSFGAKKANEPLHVLWQYDSGAVTLVNQGPTAASGLSVTAETYSLDGTKRFGKTVAGQSVGSLHTTAALTVPKPTGFSGAYLVKLTLRDSAGKEIDRNVYWWSTKTDVLNWDASDWFFTPQSQFADLSGITKMAAATVSATASTTVSGSMATTTVKLTNTGSGPVPAFFVEATLRDAKGTPVAPVSWSDNDVSLWPGESLTLTATSQTGSRPLTVDVSGVNVARRSVP